MAFGIKRVYDDAAATDGYRVLVDRLWPRGISKERAELGEWAKDIAPSTELREWFGHQPERFEEFTTRYRAELDGNPAVAILLQDTAAHDTITLVYGAHDTVRNHAVVLRDYLDQTVMDR